MEIKIQYGSRVVFRLANKTGEVYRIDEGGVWVFDSKGEKWYWPWSMITVRFPRKILRQPFPRRWPRKVRNIMCHCRIGRMEVRNEEVFCLRCNQPIGTETLPARIWRASELYRKAHKRIGVAARKVQEGIHGRPNPRSGDQEENKMPREDTNSVAISPRQKGNTIPLPKTTKVKGHQYSDNCICQKCTDTFNKALMANLDKPGKCMKRHGCAWGKGHRCSKLAGHKTKPAVCSCAQKYGPTYVEKTTKEKPNALQCKGSTEKVTQPNSLDSKKVRSTRKSHTEPRRLGGRRIIAAGKVLQ